MGKTLRTVMVLGLAGMFVLYVVMAWWILTANIAVGVIYLLICPIGYYYCGFHNKFQTIWHRSKGNEKTVEE